MHNTPHSAAEKDRKMEQLTVTILFAAGILIRHGISAGTAMFIPLSFIAVYCAYSDLDRRVIPDEALQAGLLYRMLAAPLSGNILSDLAGAFAGIAVMAAILFTVSVMYEKVRSRRAIGGGDIKLLILAGAYLGVWDALTAMFAACMLALIFSAGDRQPFPWGPAIAVGVFAMAVK